MQSGVKVEFPLQGAVASSLIDVWAQLSPQVLHQLMLSPGFSERKHIKENTDVVTVCVWSILIFQSLALKEVNTTSLLRTLSHNIQFFSLTGKFSFSEWHLVCVHVYYCVSAYWTCHHVRFLFCFTECRDVLLPMMLRELSGALVTMADGPHDERRNSLELLNNILEVLSRENVVRHTASFSVVKNT